ncbi:MAG: rhodanese-like domain-containing protein [Candidatus Kapabacteria bacterium]|nr:rhodanese-like domain-containing protein [Candidatus Kapabacteria bacterium]
MLEITTTHLKERLAAGEQLVLLDVRQPEEYAAGHIPGSVLIPLGELPGRLAEIEQHRAAEIIVICRSGNRSGQACMFLEMQGFAHPTNMRGGMLAW